MSARAFTESPKNNYGGETYRQRLDYDDVGSLILNCAERQQIKKTDKPDKKADSAAAPAPARDAERQLLMDKSAAVTRDINDILEDVEKVFADLGIDTEAEAKQYVAAYVQRGGE